MLRPYVTQVVIAREVDGAKFLTTPSRRPFEEFVDDTIEFPKGEIDSSIGKGESRGLRTAASRGGVL
jgi:hypothetical protein